MSYSCTDEIFIEAVKKATSIRALLLALNLAAKGGNYQTVKNRIAKLGLDTSHFTGQGWCKGKTLPDKRPLADYFSGLVTISSHKLKLKLLAQGVFEHKCYNCNSTTWMNSKIPLELEHKNGDHSDNNLSNLTLLCPNCHALTDTYRGKNKTHKKCDQRKIKVIKEKAKCQDCGMEVYRTSKLCKSCSNKSREIVYKINWPSNEELLEQLKNKTQLELAKELGVSNTAIRKRLSSK